MIANMAGVPKTPLTLGGRGIEISHNLVYFPGGRLFTLIGDRNVSIPEIRLHDNLLATDYFMDATGGSKNELNPGHFTLARNVVMPARAGVPGPGKIAAGQDGQQLPDLDSLSRFDFANGDLTKIPWPPR